MHRHIVGRASTIIRKLIAHNDYDADAADELMLYAAQLDRLVPEVSKPSWLSEILRTFDGKRLSPRYQTNSAAEFASFIISNQRNIESPILTPDEVNFDFDLAFDQVRESVDISTTFETLVTKLEEIIAADLIDSRVVQQALERLTALFRRNKHGSLASILVSMHYGRFALKAFSGALAANKYLKPMVDAFKQEFAVAEAKIEKAEATLKEEAVRRLTNEARLIAYLNQIGEDPTSIAGYLGAPTTEPSPEDGG